MCVFFLFLLFAQQWTLLFFKVYFLFDSLEMDLAHLSCFGEPMLLVLKSDCLTGTHIVGYCA